MRETLAIVLEGPERLSLTRLALDPPGEDDVVVATSWSGISTGTERLLFKGSMPTFPGMGYPLVPGYETVGTIVQAPAKSKFREGDTVFVPGSRCFGPVRGLFGGSASHLVSPASRVVAVSESLGDKAILFALAATAYHAQAATERVGGALVVGHGVLGRLLARLLTLRQDEPPVVWEVNPERARGALGYEVVSPDDDPRRDYRTIFDVSGDAGILDSLVGRLSPGGEIVLAGFYESRMSFAFPPAFMREARIRIAAQWRDQDLSAVRDLIESETLSLDGLITHRRLARDALEAYPTAFSDVACLKMAIDWRSCS